MNRESSLNYANLRDLSPFSKMQNLAALDEECVLQVG